MRLVKLTRFDGVPIYLNPARVLYAQPARTNGVLASGTDVLFDLAEGGYERVLEPPNVVAGLFISPLGRDAA